MKFVEIKWDKNIFDGQERLLPNSNKLYSQIYDVPVAGDAWSLVFEFKETPRNQGYLTHGRVRPLSDSVDDSFLVDGLQFEFLDGPKPIGLCTIVGGQEIEDRIISDIDKVDEARNALNEALGRAKNFSFSKKIIGQLCAKCDRYPFLFSHILTHDKVAAAEFLEMNFFSGDFFENLLIYSGLLSHLQNYMARFGQDEIKEWVNSLGDEVIIQKLNENGFG